jgi:hypothetical protein
MAKWERATLDHDRPLAAVVAERLRLLGQLRAARQRAARARLAVSVSPSVRTDALSFSHLKGITDAKVG